MSLYYANVYAYRRVDNSYNLARYGTAVTSTQILIDDTPSTPDVPTGSNVAVNGQATESGRAVLDRAKFGVKVNLGAVNTDVNVNALYAAFPSSMPELDATVFGDIPTYTELTTEYRCLYLVFEFANGRVAIGGLGDSTLTSGLICMLPANINISNIESSATLEMVGSRFTERAIGALYCTVLSGQEERTSVSLGTAPVYWYLEFFESGDSSMTSHYNLYRSGDHYTVTHSTTGSAYSVHRDAVESFLNDTSPGESPDPNDNNPNGPTEPEMTPGSFDDTSDPIPLPNLPSISVVDCGILTIYQPQVDEVRALSRYMWSDLTTPEGWWDTARKIFNDPMQYLVAFNILPFDVPQGDVQTVRLAGFSTGVSMHLAAQQYVRVDCGSLECKNYWGSALDYSPTTKMSCFLPFVGVVPIDPDFVTGTTLRVVYQIDILTGAFVANILADNNVLYHFNGNMATNVPLTGADYSRLITGLISAAGSIALTAGAGAVAGTMAGVAHARATSPAQKPQTPSSDMIAHGWQPRVDGQAMSPMQSRIYGAAQAAGISNSGATAMFAASAARAVHNTAEAIMAGKPNIAITGQMSGCSGLMDVRYPYLIVQRPNQALPENYKHYAGYPSHIRAQLSSLSGYTTFEAVELSGIPCTDSELSEIYEILKEGVYM